MFNKLTELVKRGASRRLLIILILMFIAVEVIFNFNMKILDEQTDGAKLLDMSVWYSSDFAYQQLEAYDGVPAYQRIRIADFFFPAVYSFLLGILSFFVYRKKYENPENFNWVLKVPFAAACFDYAENVLLVILFRMLPAELPPLAVVLNIITLIKFGLLALALLLIVTGALSLLKGGDSGLIMGNKFKGKK